MALPECSICLENVTYGTETPCNHLFCTECLIKWQAKEKEAPPYLCPICRRSVPNVEASLNSFNPPPIEIKEVSSEVDDNDRYQNIPSEDFEDDASRDDDILAVPKRLFCLLCTVGTGIITLIIYYSVSH